MTIREPGEQRRINLSSLPITVKIGLALVAVLVIAGLIIMALVGNAVRETQIDAAYNELTEFSRIQAITVAEAVEREISLLYELRDDPVLISALVGAYANPVSESESAVLAVNAAAAQTLAVFHWDNAEFSSIAVVDIHREIVAVNPYPSSDVEINPEDWGWFDEAYNNGLGALYLDSGQTDWLTGQPGVQIALPVYERSGENRIVGVVYAVWGMDNVLNVVSEESPRLRLIAEQDGSVLMSSTAQPGTALPVGLVGSLNQAESGAFTYASADEIEWLYGYTAFSDLGLASPYTSNLDWVVAISEPLSETERLVSLQTVGLAWSIGIAALGIAAVAVLVATITLRPLLRLTEAAEQISQGDLETPIPDLPQDEVGRLASVLRGVVRQLVDRVQNLNAAVQVSQAATARFDIEDLVTRTAQAILEQFDFVNVQVYLVEAGGRQARFQVGVGEAYDTMPHVGKSFPVNEATLLGRAIMLRQNQIGVTDVPQPGFGRVRRPTLMLVMQSGGRALGTLQLMAEVGSSFDEELIDLLTLLTDQLAAAIENARLFEQSAANLAEIEALNRRLTREAWEDYVDASGALRLTLDPEDRWPDSPSELRLRSEVVAETYTDEHGRSVLAAPLVSRGEPIGTLAVTRPPGSRWTQDERLTFEAVATRLAMAAESLRLVESTTMLAERERRVNEVSTSLLQRAASVDGVLQAALSQLSDALGSDHVSLRIGQPPEDQNGQEPDGRSPDGSDKDAG